MFNFGHLRADHREARGPSLTRAGEALVTAARSWAKAGRSRKAPEGRRSDRPRGMFNFKHFSANYREPDRLQLSRAGDGLVAAARGMAKTDKARRA